MKRKATDEMMSDRVQPSVPEATKLKGSRTDEPDMSTADDFESQDGRSAPSVAHMTTPLTTAHSTTATARRFPSDLKTIKCTWPNCTKTFNRPARLTAHLRSHNNDRPFRCSECPKAYLEEKHLRQHIKGSHTQERRYVCEKCDKAFLTATRLRRHAAVHEGQDRFRCRGYDAACTRTFRKHQTLQRHIRVDHLGQPAFVCGHAAEGGGPSGALCGAVFDSAGALRRHVERDHGVPKYWCEECSAASGVAESADADGNGDKPKQPRSSALVGFATRALLEAHMRHEHLACLFCEARVAGGPAALERHIDMHHAGKTVADRKTIVCPHAGCGKTFTRRPNLNVHIRAAHEGLRFVCGSTDTDSEAGHPIAAPAAVNVDDDQPAMAGWDAAAEGCGRSFVSKMKLEEHILYVHLRRERPPPAAAVAAAAAEPSSTTALIDALLGTNRTLACAHTGCTARFVRHHDLNAHVQREHAAATDAASSLQLLEGNGFLAPSLFAPSAAGAGRDGEDTLSEFWIGADDNANNDFDDFDDCADDMFKTYIDMGTDLDGIATNEDDDDAQWQVDEAEMRRLIGSDNDNGTEFEGLARSSATYLDPDLFT